METFLRLFIVVDIIYIVFMLSRPAAARRKKKREKERLDAERQAAAEARKREQAAAKACRPVKAAAQPHRKRGRPRKEHAPGTPAVPLVAPSLNRPHPFKGNNAFAGEVVAFTGTLDGMTRAEAIKAVELNGGRAFDAMNAGTTILVVGDDPGKGKLDKADRRISQVRKITQAQFRVMLSLPLTLTPDEFVDAFASGK